MAKRGALVKDNLWPVRRFENRIAEDTVRNEYLLHKEIHSWLGREVPDLAAFNDWEEILHSLLAPQVPLLAPQVPDLAAFNDWVYTKLFLTPASDPWLGLGPSELYSALTPAGE